MNRWDGDLVGGMNMNMNETARQQRMKRQARDGDVRAGIKNAKMLRETIGRGRKEKEK